MDVLAHVLCCILVSLAFFSPSILAEDVCVKKTPCECVFPNGTGIDLSESAKLSFFSTQTYQYLKNGAQYDLSTYYYHPCIDALVNINETAATDTCNVKLAICRHRNFMDKVNESFKIDPGNNEFLGSSAAAEFSADSRSIIYGNGPSKTVVMLICAETDDHLDVYSLSEPNAITLAFYSRNACLKQIEEVGRSFGSTLLIILFSFVLFYIVLGICTKKFLMGATGIEIIPNLAFWTDLPNLVRDGWAFAVSGFKLPARSSAPATSPDPNSYDSI